MAHFALLDENNLVTAVFVGRDEDNEVELSSRTGRTYKKTSYNTRQGVYYDPNTNNVSVDQTKAFRKNFAGIGYYYNSVLDAFIPPSPFPSWILNEDKCVYEPPAPYPQDGKKYMWDEETTMWVLKT